MLHEVQLYFFSSLFAACVVSYNYALLSDKTYYDVADINAAAERFATPLGSGFPFIPPEPSPAPGPSRQFPQGKNFF